VKRPCRCVHCVLGRSRRDCRQPRPVSQGSIPVSSVTCAPSRGLPVGVVGLGPRRCGESGEQLLVDPDGGADPDRVPRTQVGDPGQERLGPAAAVRADHDPRAHRSRQLRERQVEDADVVGGAGVPPACGGVALALPRRSSPARSSPPAPPGPRSTNASNGWNPNVRMNVGAALSIWRMRDDDGGVQVHHHRPRRGNRRTGGPTPPAWIAHRGQRPPPPQRPGQPPGPARSPGPPGPATSHRQMTRAAQSRRPTRAAVDARHGGHACPDPGPRTFGLAFTNGVPLLAADPGLSASPVPCQDGHSRASPARRTRVSPHPVKARG